MKNLLIRIKRHSLQTILTLFISFFFLLHTVGLFQWGFIDKLENFLYDKRVLFTMPGDVDTRIIIMDIDEKSLSEIGRWPWSRDVLATLINKLFEYYQVSLVGFDVVFAESDESSGLRILEKLSRDELMEIPEFVYRVDALRETLDYDLLFKRSLENRPVVLGYYFQPLNAAGEASQAGVLPPPVLRDADFIEKSIFPRVAAGYNANIPILQSAAFRGGHFSPWIDDDGVVRRVPLLFEYEGNHYESLSLAMARIILGAEWVEPVFANTEEFADTAYPKLEWLQIADRQIPVDAYVQALVPYRGYERSFEYISAVDIMQDRIDKSILKDAIILVGTTAPGLFDLRTVPVQKQYPGVEIHANLIAGILDKTIKQHPAYTLGFEFLSLFIIGVFLSVLLPLLSPAWATLVTLVTLIFTIGINFAFWELADLVLPLASSVVLILIIFLISMTYGFLIERRGKHQLTNLFGQYVPPELVDEMSIDPTSYSLEADNREMTVLFTDVRGFTTLSESLSPADLSRLMNEYLTPMTKIIHEKRGTIDKYIGDAIMAFWGAPIKDPDHARHALDTGMAMLERLNAIREEFLERGWPEVRIGVGINTGEMSVGNMGSEFRMAYTVLGDAVNLGSRLEGLTKGYGVEIIVSESTKAAVPDFIYRQLDVVRVKGKDKPIAIYEPIAPEIEITESEMEELNQHQCALDYYRQQKWEKAESEFLALKKLSPDRKLYDLYLERINQFKISPPGQNWDGVYTHTTK